MKKKNRLSSGSNDIAHSQILIVVLLCLVGASVIFLAGNGHVKPEDGARLRFEQRVSKHQSSETQTWALPDPTPNDAHDYQEVVAKLEAERVALASRYQQAGSAAQRAEVVVEARTVVMRSIYTKIFPSWYGTAWDFYGTTEAPQQGKIACGYFVSTVLRDAGWRVQRARLAQQASENIILSLTTDLHIKRFRRVPIADFVTAVREWGSGIYVVGLDSHTGFIVNTGGEVYFIHSSYVEPYMVVTEKASDSTILAASNYRVLGRITADDRFIEKWLLSKQVATRTV